MTDQSNAELAHLIDQHKLPWSVASSVVEMVQERDRRLAKLEAEHAALQEEHEVALDHLRERQGFMARRGYRACDNPACNCNSWHGGHAMARLEEIYDELGGCNGTTAIKEVARLRAEHAEALALLREVKDNVVCGAIDFFEAECNCGPEEHDDECPLPMLGNYQRKIDALLARPDPKEESNGT